MYTGVAMEETGSGTELNDEIIAHMMQPKNYGKLDDPQGVGIGLDPRSGEYVMMYVGLEGSELARIAFATNGCQDTVVLGSVFTEMVKGASLCDATTMAAGLKKEVAHAPAKQQACSELVLSAFDGALLNRAHRSEGQDEEFYTIEITGSCATEGETA
jgi:nitrogen fixation protein NifU and related proteins